MTQPPRNGTELAVSIGMGIPDAGETNILIYSGAGQRSPKELVQGAAQTAEPIRVRVHESIDDLESGLRSLTGRQRIAILAPGDSREMERLTRLGPLLSNLRLILIAPDRSEETISRGYRLGPRFMSYAEGDLSDVAAVLERMLDRTRDPNRSELRLTG